MWFVSGFNRITFFFFSPVIFIFTRENDSCTMSETVTLSAVAQSIYNWVVPQSSCTSAEVLSEKKLRFLWAELNSEFLRQIEKLMAHVRVISWHAWTVKRSEAVICNGFWTLGSTILSDFHVDNFGNFYEVVLVMFLS